MKWNYLQLMVLNKTRQEKALQNIRESVERNELIKGMWTVWVSRERRLRRLFGYRCLSVSRGKELRGHLY